MSLTILSVAYPLARVGPNAVGGAEQVLATLDAALVAAGHRSLVVACEGSEVVGELISIPAEAGLLDDVARERARENVRAAIRKVLASRSVDLVHLHGVDFYEYMPVGVPALVTLHLPLSWYPDRAWSQWPGVRFNCVSAAQQRDLSPPVDLLAPIPNGVFVEALAARHAKRNFALMLSRICPEKGIHLGIEAAERAGMPCLIGGETYRYEEHEHYFRGEVEPRLGERCRFLGPLSFSPKRRFLNAARCVLIPSLAPETASLVAMEAAGCGTPAIAFANGALAETIEHGRTGFVVSDVTEMAEAISAAKQIDPDTCRAVARERFSSRRMVERYLAAYRERAGSHGAAKAAVAA